jgi:CheY-like chemotaxis protein
MKKIISIYIVDDDQDDLIFINEAFKNVMDDIRVTQLGDGKELLDLISYQTASTMPDLILTDVNMPKINGIEALSLLKSNPASKHIPVVMLSTSKDESIIKQAYNYGASAFLTKPVSIKAYDHIAQSLSLCFLNHFNEKVKLPILSSFSNKSILIIEDSDDQWELMRQALVKSAPEVKLIRLSSRSASLDYFTGIWNTLLNPPQLILLDLYLPTRRDGLNLLDSIHYFFKIHRLTPVPVVILSASHNKEDVNASYQHDANAYMNKAMDMTYSVSYLQTLCTFWWQTVSIPKKIFNSDNGYSYFA